MQGVVQNTEVSMKVPQKVRDSYPRATHLLKYPDNPIEINKKVKAIMAKKKRFCGFTTYVIFKGCCGKFPEAMTRVVLFDMLNDYYKQCDALGFFYRNQTQSKLFNCPKADFAELGLHACYDQYKVKTKKNSKKKNKKTNKK